MTMCRDSNKEDVMKTERIRDILVHLFPGRSVNVGHDAWFHRPGNKYNKYTITIFTRTDEPPAPDGSGIIARCEGNDLRKLFVKVCNSMFEYEAEVAKDKAGGDEN